MTREAISKIIEETVFSMEVEGFDLPESEKKVLRDVLSGRISFAEQLDIYIANARLRGELSDVIL